MHKRLLVMAVSATALVLAGLAVALFSTDEAKAGKAPIRPIYLTAVEWKGSAEVAKEPFPTSPLPEGGGYERIPPDAAGKWNVETYRFDSAVVFACQGDRVVLRVFGVNAAFHDITMPDFNRNFRVNRGELTTVQSFLVKKVGIFPIICLTHKPSHRADLVVMPC
jgi:hypothetical protein